MGLINGNFVFPQEIDEVQKFSKLGGSMVKHPHEPNGLFMLMQKGTFNIDPGCYDLGGGTTISGFGGSSGQPSQRIPNTKSLREQSNMNPIFVGSEGIIFHTNIPNNLRQQFLNFDLEPYNVAWTIQELLRLMVEYADAPGNERIQVVSRSMINEMKMSDEVKQIIYETVPDGPVVRYLRGENNARTRIKPSSQKYIDERLDHWLWFVAVSVELDRPYGV